MSNSTIDLYVKAQSNGDTRTYTQFKTDLSGFYASLNAINNGPGNAHSKRMQRQDFLNRVSRLK